MAAIVPPSGPLVVHRLSPAYTRSASNVPRNRTKMRARHASAFIRRADGAARGSLKKDSVQWCGWLSHCTPLLLLLVGAEATARFRMVSSIGSTADRVKSPSFFFSREVRLRRIPVLAGCAQIVPIASESGHIQAHSGA